MLTIVKRELLRLLILAAVLYLAAVGYVLAIERREVFCGALKPRFDRIPALPAEWQSVSLTTADGVRLAAHFLPQEGATNARWCLYFHGQWGRTRWDFPKWQALHELGLGIVAFDYRGYGESGGSPSEAGIYRDADAALAWLTSQRGVAPSQVVLYGHSFGSAVAIDLASRASVGALIVDGAFRSIPASGSERYPWLPVDWLARNRFDSLGKIARVSCPKLFLHGLYDETNRVADSRALFAAATEPKMLVELEGRHEDFQWSDPARFRAALAEFVSKTAATAQPHAETNSPAEVPKR